MMKYTRETVYVQLAVEYQRSLVLIYKKRRCGMKANEFLHIFIGIRTSDYL